MTTEWSTTAVVRGVDVMVYARGFSSDPSTGIEWGPDEVWAVRSDGSDFELTDEEEENFAIRAADETAGAK